MLTWFIYNIHTYVQIDTVANTLAADSRFRKFSEALLFAFGNETDISVSIHFVPCAKHKGIFP